MTCCLVASGINGSRSSAGALRVRWLISTVVTGQVVLDLAMAQPLIQSVGFVKGTQPMQTITAQLDPVNSIQFERGKIHSHPQTHERAVIVPSPDPFIHAAGHLVAFG